jgi:hypothetical protein
MDGGRIMISARTAVFPGSMAIESRFPPLLS